MTDRSVAGRLSRPITGVLVVGAGVALFLSAAAISVAQYRVATVQRVEPVWSPQWVTVLAHLGLAVGAIGLVWVLITAVIVHRAGHR